jgi:hypothetical protein
LVFSRAHTVHPSLLAARDQWRTDQARVSVWEVAELRATRSLWRRCPRHKGRGPYGVLPSKIRPLVSFGRAERPLLHLNQPVVSAPQAHALVDAHVHRELGGRRIVGACVAREEPSGDRNPRKGRMRWSGTGSVRYSPSSIPGSSPLVVRAWRSPSLHRAPAPLSGFQLRIQRRAVQQPTQRDKHQRSALSSAPGLKRLPPWDGIEGRAGTRAR